MTSYVPPRIKQRNLSKKSIAVHGDKQQSLSFIDPDIDLEKVRQIFLHLKFDRNGNPICEKYDWKLCEVTDGGRKVQGLRICGIQRSLHWWIAMQVKLIFPQAKDFATHHINRNPRDNRLPHLDKDGKFYIGNLMLMPGDVHHRGHSIEDWERQQLLGMPPRFGRYSIREMEDWEYRLCGEMPPTVQEDDDNSDQLYLFD